MSHYTPLLLLISTQAKNREKHSGLKLYLETIPARGKIVNQVQDRTSKRSSSEVRLSWCFHPMGVKSFQLPTRSAGLLESQRSEGSEPSLVAQLFTHIEGKLKLKSHLKLHHEHVTLIYACFWFIFCLEKEGLYGFFFKSCFCPDCGHRLLSGPGAILGNQVPRIEQNIHRALANLEILRFPKVPTTKTSYPTNACYSCKGV